MPRVEAEWRLSPVWLLWLLIVLALAVALAIFSATRAFQPAPPVPPMTADTEPITDYLAIVDAPRALAFTNRRVVVKNVPVESTGGGRLFWAGKPGRDVPVILDESPPGPLAPRVQIEAGQEVNITGNVRPIPPAAQARAMWNLPQEQFETLAEHPVYIAAESVTVVGR